MRNVEALKPACKFFDTPPIQGRAWFSLPWMQIGLSHSLVNRKGWKWHHTTWLLSWIIKGNTASTCLSYRDIGSLEPASRSLATTEATVLWRSYRDIMKTQREDVQGAASVPVPAVWVFLTLHQTKEWRNFWDDLNLCYHLFITPWETLSQSQPASSAAH